MIDGETLRGYGDQISLISEGKEAKGAWNAVEFQDRYSCGNEHSSITLPKNEIVLTSVAVVDFKSKLEFGWRIGRDYSEVFR